MVPKFLIRSSLVIPIPLSLMDKILFSLSTLICTGRWKFIHNVEFDPIKYDAPVPHCIQMIQIPTNAADDSTQNCSRISCYINWGTSWLLDQDNQTFKIKMETFRRRTHPDFQLRFLAFSKQSLVGQREKSDLVQCLREQFGTVVTIIN